MSFKQKLKDEMKAVGIAALYFGCWIGALLLLKSLILAEYQIAFHGWSAVLVGALVLSKVVLVLEHVSLGAWMRARSARVEVVLRTVMYTLGVAIVLVLEKGFEARRTAASARLCVNFSSRRMFTTCGRTLSVCPAPCWDTTHWPSSGDTLAIES